MNTLTGGWWLSHLYMLDPDLVVFNTEWIVPSLGVLTPLFAMDAKSRVNKVRQKEKEERVF